MSTMTERRQLSETLEATKKALMEATIGAQALKSSLASPQPSMDDEPLRFGVIGEAEDICDMAARLATLICEINSVVGSPPAPVAPSPNLGPVRRIA